MNGGKSSMDEKEAMEILEAEGIIGVTQLLFEVSEFLQHAYTQLKELDMQKSFLFIVVESLGFLCEEGHLMEEGEYIKNRVIGRFRKIVKDQLEISGRKR